MRGQYPAKNRGHFARNLHPDESTYKSKIYNSWNSESIDLVRMLSYQNLILTPKYLEYFFYRKDSAKTAKRIVVLDRDQLNGKVCQATLTYLFLSARIGYETYIITEGRFKNFIKQKSLSNEKLKMIKGNPFMLKVHKDESDTYKGEYTDYQENIDNNGKKQDVDGKDYWELLEDLIKNSSNKIEPKSTGFSEYIISVVALLNQRQMS